MRHVTSRYKCAMIIEEVATKRTVLHKCFSSEVVESIRSEYGFAMKLERVARMRHMISLGLVMIFEGVARQRNVLHKLSSSEIIESICSEYGFAVSFAGGGTE